MNVSEVFTYDQCSRNNVYLNKVDIVKSQVFEVVSLRVLRLVKCEVLGTEDREHGQRGVSEFLMNMLTKLQIYSGSCITILCICVRAMCIATYHKKVHF